MRTCRGRSVTADPVSLLAAGATQREVVSLTEHARSAPIRLPDEARSALFHVAGDRVLLLATADPRFVVVESTSWVGTISVPGLEIRVTPRAPIQSVLAMLAGLGDDMAWSQDESRYAEAELLDGSALVVLRAIDMATRRGLLHGYQTREEQLSVIRGRLLVERLAQRPWTISSPECRYDEFTPDITENQLLRAAIVSILTSAQLTPATRREATQLLSRFDGVGELPAGALQRDIPITRLNEHYESALGLSKMALEGFSIRHEEGDRAAHAFLVDIDYVFLTFISNQLRQRLWPSYVVEAGEQLPIDDAATLCATADVLVRTSTGPALVLGANYHLGDANPSTSPVAAAFSAGQAPASFSPHLRPMAWVASDAASFFPVMVQASSLGLSEALVVYAHAQRRPASRIRMPGTNVTVHSWHLDLDAPFDEISASLDELAHRVREYASVVRTVS